MNGNRIGTERNNPYQINWSANEGEYNLTVMATDNEGATTTSTNVKVTIEAETDGGGCGSIVAWEQFKVYPNAGVQVEYKGNIYRNNWYTRNQNPETNSARWRVWTLIGSCNSFKRATTLHQNQEVKLFPNPTSEKIEIIVNTNETFSSVLIYDFQGKLIFNAKMESSKKIQIPINHLNEGVYLVKLSGKKVITKTFVKKD